MPVFTKDNLKILFVHIPKAAGSSVESAFMKEGFHMQFHDHGPKKKHSINPYCLCSPQHMHAAQLQSLFRLNSFDSIFTIVRHPINRFLSEFAMRNPGLNEATGEDVDKFFNKIKTGFNQNPFYLDNHIRMQTDFLLPNMKVFKFEDGLDKVTEYFFDRFGFSLDIGKRLSSSSLKVGPSSDIHISEKTKNGLIDFYQEDMSELGYE